MSNPPREIGTLIVVILKARNLPNKRHIGKQDPYCTVVLNGEKRRTKAIRKGGQHPEWDEEIRFTVYEDPNGEPTRTVNGDGTPPPPPPKSVVKGPPKIQGGCFMALACYAEDLREPDLIGETKVDLTEVLTKGETDEWFTLMYKEKYCGEVYLELTFWSNEPEPKKKNSTKPKGQKQYGGPGSFVPAGEPSSQTDLDVQHVITRLPSNSDIRNDLNRDQVPPSLRPSHSVAQLGLYVAPYETSRSRHSVADSLTSSFSELGIVDQGSRRQSFPPQHTGYPPGPASSVGFQDQQVVSHQTSFSFQQPAYSEGSGSYSYPSDVPAHSTGASYHQSTMSMSHDPYQPPYETTHTPPSSYQPPVRHAPRQSMPTSSSGFMPMPMPGPSGFVPLSSHHSQPSIAHSSAPTPAPAGYGPPVRIPIPSSSFSGLTQPPVGSSGFVPSGPPPPSTNYHQSVPQLPPSSNGFPYQQYAPHPHGAPQQPSLPPSTSGQPFPQAPQYQYAPALPPSVPPQSHSAPPEQYLAHDLTPPPSHEYIPPPPPLNESPSSGQPSGSRPLPQPGQSQVRRRQSSLPIPPPGGPPGMYQPPSRGPSGTFSPPIPGQQGSYNPPHISSPTSYNGPASPALARAPSGSFSTQGSQTGLYTQSTGGSALLYNQQTGAQPGSYNPPGPQPASLYNSIPPPPPLPRHRSVSPAPYQPNGQAQTLGPSPTVPPQSQFQPPVQNGLVPPQQMISRRPSLPSPPNMGYNQPQYAYQALPPPPPPPNMPPHAQYEPISTLPSGSQSQTFNPGPLPRPPAQPNGQPQYIPPSLNQPSWGTWSPPIEPGW